MKTYYFRNKNTGKRIKVTKENKSVLAQALKDHPDTAELIIVGDDYLPKMQSLIKKQSLEDKQIRLGERGPLTTDELFNRAKEETILKANNETDPKKKAQLFSTLRAYAKQLNAYDKSKVDRMTGGKFGVEGRMFPRTADVLRENPDAGALRKLAAFGTDFLSGGQRAIGNQLGREPTQLHGGFWGDLGTDPALLPSFLIGGPAYSLGAKMGGPLATGAIEGATFGGIGEANDYAQNGNVSLSNLATQTGIGALIPAGGELIKMGIKKPLPTMLRVSEKFTGVHPNDMLRHVREVTGTPTPGKPSLVSQAGKEADIADAVVEGVNNFDKVTQPIENKVRGITRNVKLHNDLPKIPKSMQAIDKAIGRIEAKGVLVPQEKLVLRKLTQLREMLVDSGNKAKTAEDILDLRRRVDKLTKFRAGYSDVLNNELKKVRTSLNADMEQTVITDDVTKKLVNTLKGMSVTHEGLQGNTNRLIDRIELSNGLATLSKSERGAIHGISDPIEIAKVLEKGNPSKKLKDLSTRLRSLAEHPDEVTQFSNDIKNDLDLKNLAKEYVDASGIKDVTQRREALGKIANKYNVEFPLLETLSDYANKMDALDRVQHRIGFDKDTQYDRAERLVNKAGKSNSGQANNVLSEFGKAVNEPFGNQAEAAGIARRMGMTDLHPSPQWLPLAGKETSMIPMGVGGAVGLLSHTFGLGGIPSAILTGGIGAASSPKMTAISLALARRLMNLPHGGYTPLSYQLNKGLSYPLNDQNQPNPINLNMLMGGVGNMPIK